MAKKEIITDYWVRDLLKEFGRYGIYLSQSDLENLMYL